MRVVYHISCSYSVNICLVRYEPYVLLFRQDDRADAEVAEGVCRRPKLVDKPHLSPLTCFVGYFDRYDCIFDITVAESSDNS